MFSLWRSLPVHVESQKEAMSVSASGGQTQRSKKRTRRHASVEGGEKTAKQRPLRQRIRDTMRLLSRDDLPETVRLTKERMLKSLQEELNEKLHEKRVSKISRSLIHAEKRKVCRKLKSQIKLYDIDAREDVHESITRLRKELNYIVHYPEDAKYQALYPSTPSSAKSIAKRESHLAGIAEQVADGELPDASLEFCTSPLLVEDGGSGERLNNKDGVKSGGKLRTEDTVKMKSVKKKVSSKVRSRLPKKALVDQEPESDSEMMPSKNMSGDDFFLDITGSSDPVS